MDEIDMYPEPSGGWIMACPCGATEIRGRKSNHWTAFDLGWLDKQNYRLSCLDCGHTTERTAQEMAAGV